MASTNICAASLVPRSVVNRVGLLSVLVVASFIAVIRIPPALDAFFVVSDKVFPALVNNEAATSLLPASVVKRVLFSDVFEVASLEDD